MERREASINDVAITQAQRLFRWPLGARPQGHPGLSDLGLSSRAGGVTGARDPILSAAPE